MSLESNSNAPLICATYAPFSYDMVDRERGRATYLDEALVKLR